MAYSRIEAALESLGLGSVYLQKLIDNEIDDDLVEECLNDTRLIKDLDAIISVPGHRIKFYKAFRSLPISNQIQNGSPNGFSTALSTMNEPSPQQLSPSALPTAPLIGFEEFVNGTNSEPMETDDESVGGLDDTEELIDLSEPQPVQIMDFREAAKQGDPSDIVFHKKLLQQILTKAKSKKVAVLAIAGPSRKGKSFFLNFVIRYLNSLKNNNPDWMGWNRSNSRLDGFNWKNCIERVTTGIWVWSEPFTMKTKNNEEFDLLIMDTQGVFDEHTTQREWSILVGLGLLTSSCLIFNIMTDLQEDSLQVFENFLSFGLMALDEKDARAPFQKLVFLIRDWQYAGQCPYGSAGGRKFIDSKLDTKGHHKESHTRVRQQLKQCFEDISCYLLPHPGAAVLALDYDGSAIESEEFAAEIEKCIMELMNPGKFPLKKINGNFLTGQDILDTFQMYCELFNSDEVPNPQSVFEITAKNCNGIVIKKCVEAFTRELQVHLDKRPFFLQDDLLKIKTSAEHSCVSNFEKSRKMGDLTILQQARDQLRDSIEASFEQIKDKNTHNLEKVVSEALETAIMEYETFMSHGIENGFLSDEAIDSLSSEGEENAYRAFLTSCGVHDSNSLPDKIEKLQQLLRSKKQEFVNKNTLNKHEAEKELDEQIQEILSTYIENISDKTQGRIVPEEDLEQFHETERKRAFNEFDELEPNQDLREDAEKNLRTRIDDEYMRVKKDVMNFNEKVRLEGKSLITEAASAYLNSMKKRITLNREDFEQLRNDSLKSAQEMVKISSPIQDKEFVDEIFQFFGDEITKYNSELEEMFERKVKEFRSELRDAQEAAIKAYTAALNELLPKTEQTAVDSEALEETHAQEKLKAIELLEICFDNICAAYEGADKELFQNHMAELERSINDEYDSIKQHNALRKDNTNAQALVIFGQAKEAYVKRMKEAGENLTDEDVLRCTQGRIKNETTENLNQQLETLSLSPQQQEELITNLHSYIETEFEGTLEVFRMKMEEDEYAVKAALLDARVYYNEEMEKHFQSKDWLEISEMQNLHDEIIETAIEKGRNQVDLSASQENQLRDVMNTLFKKYQDKNFLRMPTDSYAIGIDLGTTYSCVAVCIKGRVTVISENEKTTVPSYVAFKEDHTIDVGEAAKEQTFRRPESTIFDAKRLIGRKFSDKIVQDDMKLWPFEVVGDADQPKIKIPGHAQTYRPEQISARVLAHMKKMAEDYLNKPVTNAVVTVPAYFSDSQRQATKDAAQIAGLNAKILNEPTAAAIAYELHRTDDLKRHILIFDLGGGTFDVAVLNMKGGEINVKAIGGDTHLGGEDFDNEMVKHIIEVVKRKHNIDLGRGRDSSNSGERRDASERLRRIRAICEKQKRILSMSESTKIVIPRIDGSFDLEEPFTKADFERLNISSFKKCIDITAQIISEAHLDKSDIEDIVLIGGSTRIPKIRELLMEYFGGKALNKEINADEAVAYGAAIQAALEYGKSNEVSKSVSVSDVTPMSLGVEVHTGDMSVIIPKNTPVPCIKGDPYYTVADWQTTVTFPVFEGEERVAKDNNKLGTFTLNGLPSALKGQEPVDVSMAIDREGILHVRAVCRSTGNSESITIEAHKGRMSGREIAVARVGMDNFNW